MLYVTCDTQHTGVGDNYLKISGPWLFGGIPTPGSWPGVGCDDYSDVGVLNKCLDCANEKKEFIKVTSQNWSYMRYTTICIFRFYKINEEDQPR